MLVAGAGAFYIASYFSWEIAYLAMASLAGSVGAVRASIVTYLIPVVSTVLGVALLDETVAGLAIAGTAVVLAGAWLTTQAKS